MSRVKSRVAGIGAGTQNTEWISIQNLYLDSKNPRLVSLEIEPEISQDDLAQLIWDVMDCEEIALSIHASGYFIQEPLFAVREGTRLVVVEGNRRLTAVKVLVDGNLRKKLGLTGYRLSAKMKEGLRTLPVVIASDREEIWPYVGTRHVNGPRRWDAISKAEYIAQVHIDYGIPISDIAKTIGDQHSLAQRIYDAYLVLKQAEEEGIFNRNDRKKQRFHFSHLYTALRYEGFSSFLGLKESPLKPNPVKGTGKKKNLRELFEWLYGSTSNDIEPLITTQNPDLRQLGEILGSNKTDAIASLRTSRSLRVALRIVQGEEEVFRTALLNAKSNLQEAKGAITGGFRRERDLLDLANQVYEIAESLVSEMERQKKRLKRR